MSKKIYIFGDSYAQLNPLVDYSWPYRLDYEYDVENFAHEGTSVDYSLQKLYELVSGNYNKDGIVLDDDGKPTVSNYIKNMQILQKHFL